MRKEVIGMATLYCGDSADLIASLQRDSAVVADPPYGIGMKWKDAKRLGRKSGLDWGATDVERQPQWRDIHGDHQPFDPAPWLAFRQAILWGGNNYEGLPASRRWLVWDKRRDMTPDDHGDAELAWTNLDGVIRVHRQVWRGVVREGSENVANGPKYHPTQKPIELMRWCVSMTEGLVIDPYMGSGTTGVACADLQRAFIGVEIEPAYFEIACDRIDRAQRQERLFA